MKEEKYTAQNKYKKEHTKKISFEFNKKTDKDIIDFLSQLENKTGFIKEIIREKINNQNG